MRLNCYKTVLVVTALILFACQSKNNSKTKEIAPSFSITTTIKNNKNLNSYGLDISKYQGNEIILLDKKSDSISFVICKATEGITYTDPKFSENWSMILKKGFIRGAYHFYRSDDNPKDQASNYLSAISELQNTDFPPIVDFEEGGIHKNQSVEKIQATLLLFLKELETKLNRKPIIYTDVNTGNKYLNKVEFSDYPLWIANYTKGKQPNQPKTWKSKKWFLWQKSANYKIENTINDFDVFNGSVKELQDFIKTTKI